jgi:cytochrome b6-f complex iron-sulfur subunit
LEKISRERFIRLGSALGVGAAVASLAACGGSGSSGDSGSSGGKQDDSGESKKAGSSAAGGEAQRGGAAIARESEVAPGSAVEFKDGGQDAVLVHLESGDFAAYSAVCTHQGCTVAYQKGQLACPCHGSVFDPANGAEVVTGPAQSPLPEIPIEVKGGQVLRA